jgi:uncharacterized surface protein with fasciclin (FAS1) repeats
MLRISILSLALAAITTAAHCRAADIVDTAVSNGNFKTLVTAVKAAGLVDALKGKGPLTVFAPTDEAFANLPEGTIETLLKPENKAKLQSILTYHVIDGQVPASTVVTLDGATTLNGQRVSIQADDSGVKVNESSVIKTDIACDNGLIHVVDQVLLPAEKNLVETADAAGSFATLLAAAKAAGLAETLKTNGPFTVFAPTDEAFGTLPEGTVETLLKPENKQKLANILKYHVVEGRVYSDAALEAGSAKTLLGDTVKISTNDSGAKVNDAALTTLDIDAANGVIHVIDSVLMPTKKSEAASTNQTARKMIVDAIAEGAPIFNSGHHSACADIYMSTLQTISQMPIGAEMKHQAMTAMSRARHQHGASQKAWTLRHCLDQMYSKLSR